MKWYHNNRIIHLIVGCFHSNTRFVCTMPLKPMYYYIRCTGVCLSAARLVGRSVGQSFCLIDFCTQIRNKKWLHNAAPPSVRVPISLAGCSKHFGWRCSNEAVRLAGRSIYTLQLLPFVCISVINTAYLCVWLLFSTFANVFSVFIVCGCRCIGWILYVKRILIWLTVQLGFYGFGFSVILLLVLNCSGFVQLLFWIWNTWSWEERLNNIGNRMASMYFRFWIL